MASSEHSLPSSKLVDAQASHQQAPPDSELDNEESFAYALQLGNATALPMALQSVTELGVFDAIQSAGTAAKLSAKEIASQLSCKNPQAPAMLDRILALLASHSILRCTVVPDEHKLGSFVRLYSMAPVARFFARDSDGVSIGPWMALVQDKVVLECWTQLTDAIREGGIPFNRVRGIHAFEYLSLDPRFNQVFNAAMMNHTTIVMKKILECYKGFGGVKRLVDVGGGLGINIKLITSKYPHIQAINFDLPHVIKHAPAYPGVEHVAGDMFESLPKGDAIFMKWILHNWSDEQCLKLLRNCYDAIPDDGKVIVVEAVLPIIPENNDAWKHIAQLDMVMMTQNPAGKERTEQEFMELATGAGFRGIRIETYARTFWVMEFFKWIECAVLALWNWNCLLFLVCEHFRIKHACSALLLIIFSVSTL